MRITTALERQRRAKSRLIDLLSHAKHFALSSDDINERRLTIIQAECAKAPQWCRAYLNGYWEALIDSLYRSELCYGGFYKSNFYSTHDSRADYYGKHGIEPREFAETGAVARRGHYWIATVDAGKPKPFFIG